MQREDTCAYEKGFRFKKLLFLKSLKRALKDIALHLLHRTSAQCNEYNWRAVYKGTFPPRLSSFNNYQEVFCNAVKSNKMSKRASFYGKRTSSN